MLVRLEDLKANPFRDFKVDPIDETVVANLKASIEDDGFWGGIVCRRVNGAIQIGAGHHRVIAAMQAGIEESDVFVADEMSDASMIRVYARENMTQRGSTGTAVAGMVASVVRYLARAILTGDEDIARILAMSKSDPGRTQSGTLARLTGVHGLGHTVIEDSKLLESIPNVTTYTIQQQLANLKTSGAYTRIIEEVEAELEREHQEAMAALAAAELEQQRLQREAEEAEARHRQAEEDRKAAQAREREARKAAEEKRAAEEAKKAELAQERARIEQELAEKRRKDLAEQRKALEEAKQKETTAQKASEGARKAATTAAEKHDKTFDFEGVSQHLRNTHHIDVFRKIVLEKGVKPHLPVEDQAALAKYLIEKARELGEELSGVWIREHIINLLLQGKGVARQESKQEHEKLLRQDRIHRAHSYQDECMRYLWSFAAAGHKLEQLWKEWPEDEPFPLRGTFKQAINGAKTVLDVLVTRV